MNFTHQTVLLREAVALLKPGAGKVVVDATLGAGGHAEALLQAGARVIGIDRDPRALAATRHRLTAYPAFQAFKGNFSDVETLLEAEHALPVDGLLADLGVSSPQFDEPARGFSFQHDGPLDMRMGDEGLTAAELIAANDVPTLASYVSGYGDEPFARSIAGELKRALPKTTFEAVTAIQRAVPRKAWPKRIHVATKTFQALRIAVNAELESLEKLLAAVPRILSVGGVAAVISFHSLEDRRVKQAFRELVGQCGCPPGLPVCVCGAQGDFELLTRKAVAASDDEVAQNPRARSAHLRAVEKVR